MCMFIRTLVFDFMIEFVGINRVRLSKSLRLDVWVVLLLCSCLKIF